MTFEELVAAINARGFQINNLFQTIYGTWQANARDGIVCCEFAEAATPLEALTKLLAKLPAPRDIFA